MRRWNGWGESSIDYPLPGAAAAYLADVVGEGYCIPDTSFEKSLAEVPPAKRMLPNPLITCEAEERLRHPRGQSLPDWVALRSGQVNSYPDGVAYPTSAGQVRSLIDYAHATSTRLNSIRRWHQRGWSPYPISRRCSDSDNRFILNEPASRY